MDEKAVRQLLLVRYYLLVAAGQFQAGQEPSKFAAVNLLHEALEATLVTCADHVNASVTDRTTIDQYLNRIDEKLLPNTLPLRTRVLEFNRARISAKHALTLPDARALATFFEVIPEFIKEACRLVFKAELDSISLVELISNEEVRDHIKEAVRCNENQEGFNGLASIRKAFFVLFEKRFDVSIFLEKDDSQKIHFFDPRMSCEAPQYARSNRYVRESVSDPFGYIVLDHSKLDADSLKLGIDTHIFWNIWRLTPSVWKRPSGEWLVKHDLNIVQNPAIDADLRYVIDNMIAIALQIQSKKSQERYKQNSNFSSIIIKPECPLFSKASEQSTIVATVPHGVTRINVMDTVPGLHSDEWFWNANYMRKGGPFLFGYLRTSDTIGELLEGINPLQDD